jgi:hypothetical protein
MKTRFHRWLLGLTLLFLMPGTFLACLLLIGMIGSGFEHGFEVSNLVAAVILLIPPVLIGWGLRMLKEFRQGFHHKLRRQLFAYYLVVLIYCAIWLFSTASRAGNKIGIFPVEIQIVGSVILILPVLITLFSAPQEKREWNQPPVNILPNSMGNRFVAWLASRI